MSPKEKADSLVDTYRQFLPYYSKTNNFKRAVGSALIAVDECINTSISFLSQDVSFQKSRQYWLEVKNEINKLKQIEK
jgi:hypothetical protein